MQPTLFGEPKNKWRRR